ncbi:MAG: bifunctional diaminohydroxyphosphoribosylaminopyrimidine deaminase/5-amino-6-(5-phosphoribosylamino)uracil reductase RibD [Candidatus Scalindua sp.]|jgi:diaminohydroxyphosphoribosylaminopyrimidine deaminase/5-amino-6-(5-phosphoribosylamino)uracil reductase|nr:bifunctional diaminohydroxyphosphoribosylaminopyrimidine deaminase/5-amino-6-(5-phosphoribosylamino)uracil reductase RibD [Candidatus Scalindua sp.]MBT5305207.1 bifunctional diaminohydroxyphosphoribosylaminopyrimidine deaminase/5-amino-6-(5-phosphoribosylamino)uracil reductase RibD [Candidatus Scalindua sp.]MBT6228953.1 bifunctional diaminohydroxyphosphoribosylaminopyrimidine deaminase/5-amino-6-(5-phosphoribosylamino)uracil reductase RibD [Candidatus Scalindua sp.]MBT6561403.1 bifunctional d
MKKDTFDDKYYMGIAIRLARKGIGKTSPNPMVGAVIVANGKIIGRGYHKRCGDHHAEINAINNVKKNIKGSTFYITLEPCSHYGRTPPCVDALIQANPERVVVGSLDPNPEVNGKGVRILRSKDIKVDVGVLESECRQLNESYFKFIKTGMPYITVKYAQTLDGRIATKSGDSQWISSEASRKYVHRLRSVNDGIMVGAGTVAADNPQLTVRHVKGKNPIRIIVDSKLRISIKSSVLTDANTHLTLIAVTSGASDVKISSVKKRGAEVLVVKKIRNDRVNLKDLLIKLGKREIISVLVEGGSEIITSLLKANLVDKMIIPIAPKIIGKGLDAIGDLNINKINNAVRFSSFKTMKKGDDIIFEGTI